MKVMNVVKWKAVNLQGQDKEESIVDILMSTINRASASIGTGIEQFRFLHRLSEAFDRVEKIGKLEIEDGDYEKLSVIIKKHLPSGLGFSPDIYKAVEEFLKL